MTVIQPPDDSGPDRLLPLRWAIILGLSTAVAMMTGAAEGVAFGVLAGLTTAGALHTLME